MCAKGKKPLLIRVSCNDPDLLQRVPDPVILPILGNKPDPSRLNVPVDSSSSSLFDTAYVHHRLRDHMLLWEYYDFFIKSTLWLVGGSKYGLGQYVGGISEGRYHASKSASYKTPLSPNTNLTLTPPVFFNKSNKAMPYISAPYKAGTESSLTERIRSSRSTTSASQGFPAQNLRTNHIPPHPPPTSATSTTSPTRSSHSLGSCVLPFAPSPPL